MPRSALVSRWLEVTARRRLAVLDDGGPTAFRDLGARAAGVAAELVGRGVAGQRVALLGSPGAGWVAAFFGTLLSGNIVVPLSPLHPQREQRSFIERSRSVALLVTEAFVPAAAKVAGGRPVLPVEACTHDASFELPASRDEDSALILYTSGTTGEPKGALISHGNIGALARLLGTAWGFSDEDRLVHTLPLHHLHGIGISLMVSLLSGSETRMLDRFDAERVWEELGGATVLMGVPTQHKKLFDSFEQASGVVQRRWARHGRGLRLVTSGSAALSPALGRRWLELSGQYPLERYGMTEVGIALSNPLDGERRPGSVGVELPGMQVRLIDESGRDVGGEDPGEIWIRGPTVFAGYDQDSEATRAAFCDGWFKSGDTACWLDGAYVKILGRTSVDILKSGGYKLSALEIEDVLREHDGVADVAVVGVQDETWGDRVVAVVVAKDAGFRGAAEAPLRAWAKERLAAYKVPKEVVVVDELPRNALGKVVKPELAAWLRRKRD